MKDKMIKNKKSKLVVQKVNDNSKQQQSVDSSSGGKPFIKRMENVEEDQLLNMNIKIEPVSPTSCVPEAVSDIMPEASLEPSDKPEAMNLQETEPADHIQSMVRHSPLYPS
jgi:hypothetical protein